MKSSAYELGRRHGYKGIRPLAHRNGKRYDSASKQGRYTKGYVRGSEERLAEGRLGLDYSKSENYKLFE